MNPTKTTPAPWMSRMQFMRARIKEGATIGQASREADEAGLTRAREAQREQLDAERWRKLLRMRVGPMLRIQVLMLEDGNYSREPDLVAFIDAALCQESGLEHGDQG